MNTANLLETTMIICFGLSWPLSIYKSATSKSTKGKSLMFMLFILFGYFCGLGAKIITHNYNLAYYFYYPNIIMVIIDVYLYLRNKKLEAIKLNLGK